MTADPSQIPAQREGFPVEIAEPSVPLTSTVIVPSSTEDWSLPETVTEDPMKTAFRVHILGNQFTLMRAL